MPPSREPLAHPGVSQTTNRAALSIDRYFGRPGALYDQPHQVVEVHYDEEAYLKTIARKEPLRAELEAFVQAVQGSPTAAVKGEDGLQVLRLALQLVEAGEQHAVWVG